MVAMTDPSVFTSKRKKKDLALENWARFSRSNSYIHINRISAGKNVNKKTKPKQKTKPHKKKNCLIFCMCDL